MIDIKILRENPQLIADSLKKRGNQLNLDEILQMDQERRDLIFEVDKLKKERNENSQKIGKGQVEGEEKQAMIERTREMGETIKAEDERLKGLEELIESRCLLIPNLLAAGVPEGNSEEENVEIKKWGEPRAFDFEPKHHADVAERLDVLDAPRGVKLAQSRFTLVKGHGAQLERALVNFMLETHTAENGYQEVTPPLLVNKQTMTGTGQLPKFEEDLFKTTDGLYLIPSAEVPVTNIFAGEILQEDQLPQYFTSFTPCFRSEAGSYGKDTKGYIRQHQFNKVELVKLTHPETSHEEHLKLLGDAERILQALELPYRVVELCSGDLGFSAQKCFDIEVWIPSESRYREISSCSNCGDFQARRASIKFKPKEGGKPQFVHTLNGSGLAVGRTLVAILENYQEADGSVRIPKVLQSYMRGLTEITPPK